MYKDIKTIISDLKRKYIENFNEVNFNDFQGETVIHHMISKMKDIDIEYYRQLKYIFSLLKIKQWKNYVLVRYLDFTELYNRFTPNDFWNLYDGLYRGCRSIVFDMRNETKPILHGYDKFFNVNELNETTFEKVYEKFKNCSLYEVSNKLDGSMVLATMLEDDTVIVATSHSINPETSWRLELAYSMIDENINKMLYDNKGMTFIFEMISDKDTHIVNYSEEENGLYLIGCRNYEAHFNSQSNLLLYSEIKELAEKYNVKVTNLFNLSLTDIMNLIDTKKSDEAEGFVVRIDNSFYKIKYNDYVTMHKVLGKIVSPNAVIESISKNQYDDFYSRIPLVYKDRVDEIAKIVFNCINLLKEYVLEKSNFINNKFNTIAEKMIYIDSLPRELQGYVRKSIVGKDSSLFSIKGLLKLNDIKNLTNIIENVC